MEFQPILAAMSRNKIGAVLIGVQIAITLAILVNGLFIIQQRVALSHRATGLDEPNVFTIRNQWVGNPTNMEAKLRTDLSVLRSLPGVIDATASNSAPLSNGGSSEGVNLDPDQQQATALTAVYFMDDHALNALGVKLIAGRNFTPDEVTPKIGFDDRHPPSAIIMSKALADKVFPAGDALGKSVYLAFQKTRVPIVGIVDRLQVPWTGVDDWGSKFNDNATLEPFQFESPLVHYVVRTKPGQIVNVMKAAEKALLATDRLRILEQIQTQSESRLEAYRDDHGLVVILGIVCAALIAVTAFGIVGLTSY
jgi:putative ABC transport system permease protein